LSRLLKPPPAGAGRYTRRSSRISLTPHGAAFDVPVEVTIPYDTDGVDPAKLVRSQVWTNPARTQRDEQVANRNVKVWHGATENGP
jgi:hypothetical protein